MPATRLLVIADSKMLPALANGLRDSAKFDVHTAPLSDPAGAQAAAEKADAVVLFYGAPGAPLPAALQALSPKVRERGGRIVAVLQREQASHRDDCFRSGASDLLFMPMPKDQFVARLQGSVELSWADEGGATALVSVATRTSSTKHDQAKVSASGVDSPGDLPLKAGETVRLQWGTFQSWGLVVRGGPSTQIRFAGLTPDEEAQIRDWLKGGAQLPAAGQAVPAPAAARQEKDEKRTVITPPAPAPDAQDKPTPTGGSAPAEKPAGGRAAPAAGPPPGFADRKPIRPQAQRVPARVAPPVMSAGGSAPAPSVSAPPSAVSAPTPPGVSALAPGVNGAPAAARTGALSGLFEEGAAPAPAGARDGQAAAPDSAQGPTWPVPIPAAVCRAAAMHYLKERTMAPDTPSTLAASVRKVTGMLGSTERNSLDKAGPDSHLADALVARIALDAATSEGVKLYSSFPAATMDAFAAAALARQADEAASRLQTEANAAMGKGEVESLQMVSAASAALSRDLLNFKETADRLRGLSAAPRLGAGALDPDMVLPGQAPRPKAAQTSSAPAPVRAELRDFQNLDARPRSKQVMMVIALAAFVAALTNALYFGMPHRANLSAEAAGAGIERIDVSGESALVTVSPAWLARAETGLPQLVSVLKENGLKKAVLLLPDGNAAGLIDVASGKVAGLAKPKAAAPPK